MRSILILFALSFIHFSSFTQSCCQLSSEDSFASFGNDELFLKAHPEPIPLNYKEKGEMIAFKVKDDVPANAYFVKANKPTNKYVIVIHEWWGLNEYIKRISDDLSKDLNDVNVLALDLYDGESTSDRGKAAELMQGASEERINSIILGARDYVGPTAEIATIGWCFGGGWSLQTSLIFQDMASACVIYYGMPEANTKKLKQLKANVLGIFALKDGWVTPQIVDKFEEDMIGLEKELDIVRFDAEHAFANPSNPNHDPKAANKAYKISLEFIAANWR